MSRDRIFAGKHAESGSFEFDEEVAAAFPDMLERSIPGYSTTIDAIGVLASRFVQPETNCYDLGCSLGAATLAMRRNIDVPGCKIIAVDRSAAMITRLREVTTGNLMRVEIMDNPEGMELPSEDELPDMQGSHIDPFTGLVDMAESGFAFANPCARYLPRISACRSLKTGLFSFLVCIVKDCSTVRMSVSESSTG